MPAEVGHCEAQTIAYDLAKAIWNEQESTVDFRLIYQGKLPAASRSDPRAREKQLVRKQLHPQLRELWSDHPALRSRMTPSQDKPLSEVEEIANNFARAGCRFVPLIRERSGLTCSIDVLFLRRDNPGNLVKSGGDIDNRLKVLLDGLRLPNSVSELGGLKPEPDEDPLFCLLEDDALITGLSVTTDRLLVPQQPDEHSSEVVLIIHVKVKATTWQALIQYGYD